jgi:Spy/CpxP family protein refolding chaperone
MTRKGFSTIALALGAAAMLAFGAAYAQNPPAGPPGQGPGMGRWAGQRGPMGPMGMMGMFRRLDLSAQQKDELKAAFQAQRDQRQAVRDRLRKAEQALQSELLADTPDQGKIQQLQTDLTQAQQDALSARIAMELKINQILTPAQRQQLRDAQARRASRAEGRRGQGGGGSKPGGRM